jgi:hypothetical protein
LKRNGGIEKEQQKKETKNQPRRAKRRMNRNKYNVDAQT